jgi:NAD-dependent deacetylase
MFRSVLDESKKGRAVIVLGSTLSVIPANQFPLIVKDNGA